MTELEKKMLEKFTLGFNEPTGKWWLIPRDCGQSEPIGPFDSPDAAWADAATGLIPRDTKP